MFLDSSRFTITLNHLDKFFECLTLNFFADDLLCILWIFLSGVSRWIASVIFQTSQYELPQYSFWRLMIYCCYIMWNVSPCILSSIFRTPYHPYRIFDLFRHLTNTIDNLWVFNREYSRRCLGRLKIHYLNILSSVYMNFPDISFFVSR